MDRKLIRYSCNIKIGYEWGPGWVNLPNMRAWPRVVKEAVQKTLWQLAIPDSMDHGVSPHIVTTYGNGFIHPMSITANLIDTPSPSVVSDLDAIAKYICDKLGGRVASRSVQVSDIDYKPSDL